MSDHGLVRAGVKQILAASSWPGLLGEVGTLPEALAEVRAHPYQGVIAGLGREEAGEAWLQGWRRGGGRLPVLVISLEAGVASMRACLGAGAAGYLSGMSAEGHLVEALTAILSGESYLDPRLAGPYAALEKGGSGSGAARLSEREYEVLERLV